MLPNSLILYHIKINKSTVQYIFNYTFLAFVCLCGHVRACARLRACACACGACVHACSCVRACVHMRACVFKVPDRKQQQGAALHKEPRGAIAPKKAVTSSLRDPDTGPGVRGDGDGEGKDTQGKKRQIWVGESGGERARASVR